MLRYVTPIIGAKHLKPFNIGTVAKARYNSSNTQNQLGNNHNAALERIKREIEADKKALQWRTPISEKPDEWVSKLKTFEHGEQTSDYIVMMQQPLNWSPTEIKKWWQKRQEHTDRHMQSYIPERMQILGVDLGAAHFILFRGGAVKFMHDQQWMRANDKGEFKLPSVHDPKYKLEAMRCDNMKLYYEGLENIRCLQNLKFLSFHNVKTFDDWCLDRVSGSQYPKLEILDISGTSCTSNGFSCLYRIPTLKLLIVNDPKESLKYELTCAMLEEAIPSLKIVAADTVHKEE